MKCQVLVVTLCLSFQWMGYAEGQVISPQNSSLLQQPQYSSSFSSDKDVGHWSVENCILAKFGMNFTLRPDMKNRNKTRAVKVNPQAIADNDKGFCGNTTQELRLHWYDPETNSTENLFRNITVVFGRADNATYGVLRLFGKLEIAHFNQYNNKTNKTEKIVTSIHIDTGNNTRLEYQTPVNRSYLCTDLGDWNLLASLHYSSDDKPLGTKLPNASISTRDVQFDAFRSVQTTPLKFQSAWDCEATDWVPIGMAILLFLTVVITILIYIRARYKWRRINDYVQV